MTCTIEQKKLDQEVLDRIFGAYTEANKSHWQAPPLGMITKKLTEQQVYTYTAGQPDNWSTKLHFMLEEQTITIDISINKDLPASMQSYAEKIKDEAMDRIQVVTEQISKE